MKKLWMIAAMMVIAIGMQAQAPARVPAFRGMIERVQPNGDTIRTYLRGDEHKHWMLTEDGWQIFENDKGWYVYAKSKKGKVVMSRKKVHNAEDRCKCEKRWLEKKGVKKE